MPFDAEQYREILRQWVAGVTIVTMRLGDGALRGFTVSSFTWISRDPALVLISVDRRHQSYELLQRIDNFAVNILHTGQLEWGKRFAGMGPEMADPFADMEWRGAHTGAPILPGVPGWLDCRIHQRLDVGDHGIVIGAVAAVGGTQMGDPLAYYKRTWGTFSPLPADD